MRSTRPPTEPRILERRIPVRRRLRLRQLNVLVYVGMVIAVLLVAVTVSRTPLLDVDTIAVEGATNTPAEEVVRVGEIHKGDPMIGLDLDAAASRLTSLPWVRRATVQRTWPGTIEYAIEEWEPVAVVVAPDGTLFYVGPERHLLGPAPSRPVNLVELRGVSTGVVPGEGVGPDAEQAIEVALALPGDLVVRLPVVSQDGNGEVVLERSGGGEVRLGLAGRIDEKLAAVRTVLDSVDLACLGTLDVRVPTAPVISRVC